ncbi:MAG: hypothetical protein VYE77_12595 [Planctomycetota bacterium]|nr:hypothetical protein [Planctomycetota bacterium]
MVRIYLAVLAAIPGPALLGQGVLGLLNGTDTSFTSRGSSSAPNTNPSFAFARIDHEHYAGWGIDPANPGTRTIQGMRLVLQDQIGSTAETYGMTLYPENATLANYPDVAAPLAAAGPFPTPPNSLTTAAVFDVLVNFATPVAAPTNEDLFLAVELPQPAAGGTWPTDGLSMHALYYVNVTSGSFDLPGGSHPTAPPEQGNGGYHVPSIGLGPTYTTTPRQWKIEPLVPGATGVPGTITNQVSAPQSTTAPGTSSMASGLHPDATSPPLNPGRVDDISGRWFRSATPNNTPVFFLLDLGTFGPEIPMATILAGSTGVSCLNLATAELIGLSFTINGEATFPIAIPAAARPLLAGVSLMHQAAGFNATTGGIDANGCTRQVF